MKAALNQPCCDSGVQIGILWISILVVVVQGYGLDYFVLFREKNEGNVHMQICLKG